MVGWVSDFAALEPVCRRAPSAHNTQPWVLSPGDASVAVHWDPERALPLSDPSRRDLFLSLGAFVESCLIAAADAGLPVAAEVQVDEGRCQVARLVGSGSRYATPFGRADLEGRRCSRGAFAPGPVPGEVLEDARRALGPVVGEASGAASAPAGVALHAVTCADLAALLLRADRWMFGTPGSVAELRSWLRLSPRHPRYRLDGLTYDALDMSRPEAAGLSAALHPAVYRALRPLGLPKLLAAMSEGVLSGDGQVLVLTGPVTSTTTAPAEFTEHGRALLRLWLALARSGVAVHPLSQLIDCPDTSAAITTLLGLTGPHIPLAVFRAGHPMTAPPRSSRLPVG